MIIRNIKISGVSACVPRNIEKVLDAFGHDKIDQATRFSKITGISERRIVDEVTLVSDLVLRSCQALLEDCNRNATDIDVLIVVTQTGDNSAPGVALKVANLLGCRENLVAFDINLGCSSFPYGLAVASSLLNSLGLQTAMLCMGDISSRICDPDDMSTYPLFGDGAGAVLINKTIDEACKMVFDLNSDGSGRYDIFIGSGGMSSEYPPISKTGRLKAVKSNYFMSLKGANVFSFAINKVPKSILHILNTVDMAEPDICVLHQANKKINSFIERALSFSSTKFPTSLQDFGNTSSVTIPLTLVANYGGKSLSGSVIASGFGVGLSWGSVFTNLHECKISKLEEL